MSETFDCDTATAPEMANAVVNYIEKHGWTRGILQRPEGSVCLVGALGGICTGDPKQGYGVCNGYRLDRYGAMSEGINGSMPVPAGVIALALALTDDGVVSRVGKLLHRSLDETLTVTDSVLTLFNDSAPSLGVVLAPFRRIAGLPEVADV